MKKFIKFWLLMIIGSSSIVVLSQNSIKGNTTIEKKVSSIKYDPSKYPTPKQGGENIASAIAIETLPYTNTGTTEGYIDDYDAVCPYTGSTAPDVVYQYSPASDEALTIDLCGSAYDTKLFVFESTVDNVIACNDDNYFEDPCGIYVSALYNVNIHSGNTYYIIIDGYDGGSFGDYSLSISAGPIVPPPANDECTSVTPITLVEGVPVTFSGNNNGATVSCPSFFYRPDVWEAFTLTGPATIVLDYCGSGNGTAWGDCWLNLSTSCPCAGITPNAAYETSSCGDGNFTLTWTGLAAGTYWYPVMLNPSDNSVGDYTIHVVATALNALSNDNCESATPINEVTDLPFTTIGATFDGSGTCMSGGNIWYDYTSTVSGNLTIDLCGSTYDTKLAVYNGFTCLGTNLGCDDDACGPQSSLTIADINAGQEFKIEVGGYGTATGIGDLSVKVTPPCSTIITSFPYTEDFESGVVPPGCWSQIITNPTDTWHAGPGYAVCFHSQNQNEWLISPEFDFSSLNDPHVSFDWKTNYNWMVLSDNGDYLCNISTDNGISWTTLWLEEDEGPFGPEFYTKIIDLSLYAGYPSVKIAFQYIVPDNYAETVFLDNFIVQDGPFNLPGGFWTGEQNNDWLDPGNWDNGIVPASSTNVIIPSSCPFFPHISSNANCKSITISSGAKLFMNSSSIEIASNLTVYGELIINGGTMNVNGNLLNEMQSFVTISDGILNIGIDWTATNLWANGTFNLNGGIVNLTGDARFAYATINMAGPFEFHCHGNEILFCGVNQNNTTNGTFFIETTNLVFDLFNPCGGNMKFYNLIINSPGTNIRLNPWDQNANLLIANDMAILAGYLTTYHPSSLEELDQFDVLGNFTIGPGTNLTTNAVPINVGGNWSNNGTFLPGIGTVTFNGANALQTIGGSSTTTFNILKVNKGAQDRILEATSLIGLSASANPLIITSGTFKLSSASVISPFSNGDGATIPLTGGFWNNGGTINSGNFSWTNYGLIRNSTGNLNIGISSGNSLKYYSGSSFIMEGGALNIAGRFYPNSATQTLSFTMSDGILTIADVGYSSGTAAGFDISASGSSYTMSGGTIIIENPNGNATTPCDYRNVAGTANITGGTIQFATDVTGGSPIFVVGVSPTTNVLPNLTLIKAATSTTVTFNAPVNVKGDVTIAIGSTLNANGKAMEVTGNSATYPGNWTNNGVFTSGSGVVTFNGPFSQIISGSSSTTFNNLVIANTSDGVSLTNDEIVSGILTLTAGNINTGINILIVSNTIPGSISGGSASSFINGNLQRNISDGTNTYSYPIGTAMAYAPVSLAITDGTVAGTLKVNTSNADHANIGISNINPASSVNRNWTFTVISGLETANYNATFNWSSSDQDPGFNYANAICGKYSGSSWSYPAVGALTETSVQITGGIGFSDFQIGNSNCVEPDVPTVLASPSTICAGNSSTLSVTSGNLNDATNWNWYSGSCGGTLVGTGTSLVVFPSSTTTYYVRGEGGCSTPGACAQVTVTVNPTALVDGYFKYYNSASTALDNVDIKLKQSDVTLYSSTTNPSGYFSFDAVCPGTYDVVASKATIIGGVNSTDAAQVNYWTANHSYIETVRFLSGDVDGSSNVWSDDALSIQQYFITQGNPTPAFDADWSFWKVGELINSNPGPLSYPTITISEGTTSVTQNFYGLLTGDFNRSYVPGNLKSGSENLTLNYGQVLEVNQDEAFELPLVTEMDMEVSAISLILNFPSEILDVNGVYLTNDPNAPMQHNVSGDELRIGWNSLLPVVVQTGEPLLTLLLEINSSAGEEGIRFKLAGDPLNELADGSFEVISNALLTVDILKTSELGTDELSLSEKLTLSNHPNPFKGTTSFTYSLPVDGKVTLEIYDIVGNKIKVLVDETQTAGDYQLKMEQSELQPGVYTASLKLENSGDVICRTIKIINKNN